MNEKFIEEIEHQSQQPVSIERAEHDVIIIEGVRYSGNFFRTAALPNPENLYAMRREGEDVILTTIPDLHPAEEFFNKPGGA